MSSSPTYLDPLVIPLIKGDSVLDVACGYGRWGQLIQTNFWEAGLQQPPVVDGIDGFAPNVERCRRLGFYRNVIQQLLPGELKGKWATVLACEILEHLPESSVDETIALLESVAEQRIIFSTPNWPYLRGGGNTLEGFNDLEAHLSYVPRSKLKARGYVIQGAGFGNPKNLFVRVISRLRLQNRAFAKVLPTLFPSCAAAYVAYRDL